MSQGWVKLHRSILDSSLWFQPNAYMLFSYLLMKACHSKHRFPFNGSDMELKPGQLISSHDSIKTGMAGSLTIKQIRVALDYLKRSDRVAVQTTNRYSIITITNWDKYQTEGSQEGDQRADKGQSKGRQRATNKNVLELKNENNDKNTPLPPTGKRKRVKVEKYRELREEDFEHRWPNQWREGGKQAMRDWIDYKAKGGHPAILESYLRQLQQFDTKPKLFADLVNRAIGKGWQGLNEELPFGEKPNPITAAADAKVAGRPQPKIFVPPEPESEHDPETRARIKAMLSGFTSKVKSI